MFNHADFWFAIDGIIPRCARAKSSRADRLDFPEIQSDAYPVNAVYSIPANFYLGGSAQDAPSALGCPPKTQLLSGGQTAKALRCNVSQASKAKIDAI
jgi:hypothetical protein